MKKHQRLMSFLLAALMIGSSLVSCSEKSVDETQPTAQDTQAALAETEAPPDETVDPMLQDDLPEANFDGYTFRILSCEFVGRELASFLMAEEVTGDAVNDALFNITTEVEDRFNVDITYINVANTGVVSETVRTSVNGGTDDFDMQCGVDTTTANLGRQGMFFNLYDIPQFNTEKPWWPKKIMSQLDVAGKLFIGSTYLTFNGLHWTRTLIANKDRFEELQIEMPYEDIINGTWYLDDMYTLCSGASRDLDGDGEMTNNDFYGFALGSGVTYCLQDTFGLSFYQETEEGMTSTTDQERADAVIESLRDLIQDKKTTHYDGSAANEFCIDIFLQDKALIATTMIGTAYDSFRDASFAFSILPFPKFDELQNEYINTCTDAFWAIPITAVEHLDVIGTVIEALSCQNYQRVLPLYYETAIKGKLSDSPDDAAMFDIIRESRTIGFEYAYSMTFRNIIGTCIISNNVGFSSYYKRWQKSSQKEADKIFEEMKNLHQ